ncbi:MAG: hypothetical protein JO283_05880 [Bradyrhizobium sp.]|nr:hypothetical protein [Bradyrhizobium sp.]
MRLKGKVAIVTAANRCSLGRVVYHANNAAAAIGETNRAVGLIAYDSAASRRAWEKASLIKVIRACLLESEHREIPRAGLRIVP